MNLNSYNRTTGTTQNWTVDFATNLIQSSAGFYDSIKIEPLQCVISRSWYTIDTPDNVFIFTTNSFGSEIIIPPAFFNIQTFIQYLENVLPVMTVTWIQLTNQFVFSVTDPSDTNTYGFDFDTQACALFGFDLFTNNLTFDVNNPLTSIHPVKMCLESVLLVHTDLPLVSNSVIGNLTDTFVSESNTLLKIPLGGVLPFDLCVWRSQGKHIYLYELTERCIQSINFYLTDEFARPISPHFDWTISLRLEYYTFDQDPQVEMKYTLKSINDYLRYLALHKLTPISNNQKTTNKKIKNKDKK
jgi:hypothetical protein